MAAVEARTEIRLLGGFSVRRGGEEIAPGAFRGRLVRTLIRVLITRRVPLFRVVSHRQGGVVEHRRVLIIRRVLLFGVVWHRPEYRNKGSADHQTGASTDSN